MCKSSKLIDPPDSNGIIPRTLCGGASDQLLKVGQVKEIYEMKGADRSIRKIAQDQDISRNTLRRYLKSPEAMRPPRGVEAGPAPGVYCKRRR